MSQKLIALAATALIATGLQAQTQTSQFAVTLGASTYSADGGVTGSGMNVGGAYYFKPLTLDGLQPFMEQSFLQRASYVSFTYDRSRMESRTVNPFDTNQQQLGLRWVLDNWVLGLSAVSGDEYTVTSKVGNPSYRQSFEGNQYTLGYYVLPHTVLSFEMTRGVNKTTPSPGQPAVADYRENRDSITTQSVLPLNNGQFFRLDLSYSQIGYEFARSGTNTEYGARLRFYPEAKYYMEAGYRGNTGSYAPAKGGGFSIGAGYAFTPRLSAIATMVRFLPDDSAVRAGSSTTTLAGRYLF